jgi:hypothetical protein
MVAKCYTISTTSFPKMLASIPVFEAYSQSVSLARYSLSRHTQTHLTDPSDAIPSSSSDLDDITDFSYLTTTNHLTGHGFSLPYPAILRENGTTASTDGGLSPSSIPSPTSSFVSSLSPSSLYDSLAPSDSESPVSPSPVTPDQQYFWPSHALNHQSSDSLMLDPFIGSFPNDSVLHPDPQTGPHRRRSQSSPSRHDPVASKAMLEANGRRRRHPAQFECEDCKQTFTALFSLKREFSCIFPRGFNLSTPHPGHAQSHTGTRPYPCGIPGCTQRFFNSSDCKRHEKSQKRHKDLVMQ